MKADFFVASPTAGAFAAPAAGRNRNAELASEFSKLIASFRDQANADMLKRKQEADEKAAEKAKEKKEEKIDELLAMIARLKAKIGSCGAGGNSGLEAELAQLESQLMMLLLFS